MIDASPFSSGVEWIVDAHGCDPALLRSRELLRALFDRIVEELSLRPIGEPLLHVFPGEGGVTGLLMLSESHLACHTFPETGYASFNLYCCRPRLEWPWAVRLGDVLGASEVTVRVVERPAVRTE
jgi:S-adenosylmethionine decarboxylase